MKRKLAPVHSGEILWGRLYSIARLDGFGSVSVSRPNLSAIINGRASISTELAIKLSEAFGNTAQFWVNLQKNYELWHAEKKVNRSGIRLFGKTRRLEISVKLTP